MDEDGVEELVGEAEVVALEPRNDGVRGAEGVGGRGKGLEKGVPVLSRHGAIGLGESELDRIKRVGRIREA